MYISYLSSGKSNICLCILTLDNNSFHNCQLMRKSIESTLINSNYLTTIQSAYDVYPINTTQLLQVLKLNSVNTHHPISTEKKKKNK